APCLAVRSRKPGREIGKRRRREVHARRAGSLLVGLAVADVKRATREYAEPLQRELEDPWIGLRGARLGRGDDGREAVREPEPSQVLRERDVPVRDDGEPEAEALELRHRRER